MLKDKQMCVLHFNVLYQIRGFYNMCQQIDIKSEFQFILKCPFQEELRKKYIKRFHHGKPNAYKLVKLLSVDNTNNPQ